MTESTTPPTESRWQRMVVFAFLLLVVAWLVWMVRENDALTAIEVRLFGEMGVVIAIALLATLAIVAVMELPSFVQSIVNPSADEHRASVDYWRNAKIETIESDPTALALYLGAVAQASAIRATGRYVLIALIILAVVWAFQPFAASLV